MAIDETKHQSQIPHSHLAFVVLFVVVGLDLWRLEASRLEIIYCATAAYSRKLEELKDIQDFIKKSVFVLVHCQLYRD